MLHCQKLFHTETLKKIFDNCLRIKGTRTFHAFAEKKIHWFRTSKTDTNEDNCISKIVPLSLEVNDTLACLYNGQLWLAQIEQVNLENNDVHFHFHRLACPCTSFNKSTSDRIWILISKILRKISVLVMTTVTGRSHFIFKKLSEEISMLLNGHLV